MAPSGDLESPPHRPHLRDKPPPPHPPPQTHPAAQPPPAAPALEDPPALEAPPASDTRATPTARNVAKNHDVNLASIQGSGAAGRVMKQDVQRVIAPAADASRGPQGSAPQVTAPQVTKAPSADRREERQRMSKRRATIGWRPPEAPHNAARGGPRNAAAV